MVKWSVPHLEEAAATWFKWILAIQEHEHCVISLFSFSKKARNPDFYVIFPNFFQYWHKLMLFLTLQDSMASSFQETLASVLS